MGEAASGNQYGKLDPPNTDNPGAKFEANDGVNHDSIELKNPHSEVLSYFFNEICSLFQMYGWYLVFTIIFGIIVWTNIRQTFFKLLNKLQKQMSEKQSEDSGTIQKRLEAMEKARLRMQANYEEQSREKLIKIKEREEQKRINAIQDHDALKSGKSQSSTLRKSNQSSQNDTGVSSVSGTNKPKKSLRQSDYNPLTGTSNNGPRYRPSSRRPTAGG